MVEQKKQEEQAKMPKQILPRNREKRLDCQDRRMCLFGPGMDFLVWGID